ncbi:hypothetical protein EUGRSUZ_K02112 [Eucalyptus grandis]|uniref:glucan endo-1,3-beta-D-glucosidase n=2 Tax=Eucalyptus grandis TaxID=71139 RepID=A0A059A3U9_EUCGR|nr:hypothetical protein EUGRSUZ_K02112 [Eucalyptus grandis]
MAISSRQMALPRRRRLGAEATSALRVNYGQLCNNLPSSPDAVRLIKKRLSSKSVKLYDANPQILLALRNTGLEVCAMVPNELIANISADQALSDHWVGSNIIPFYPDTKIRHLLVGNEILSDPGNRHRIRNVKVGISMAMETLEGSSVYPPSNGSFRSDISGSVMKPMLQFLSETKSDLHFFFFFFGRESYLYFDAYPYFHWAKVPEKINLDYALFESKSITYKDPGTGLVYTNLFDQMVDSMVFAMKKLGYPNVQILMAETGWPIKKLTARPPVGTPARPRRAMQGFIFALFNENQKPGPTTERHFGLLYPNGSKVYQIDLRGKTTSSGYEPLPEPTNNKQYKGPMYCSQGNNTCEAIRPGKACHNPDLSLFHANYAFSSYWAEFRNSGASCFLNGLATQTIKDPSHGSCKFPSVAL